MTHGASLIENDPLLRAQRRVGLIPGRGFGTPRRVLLFVGITWLPVVLWAALRHRLMSGVVTEPLLEHFGVHVRLLVALPALIVGEALGLGVIRRAIPYFQSSGLLPGSSSDEFNRCLASIIRLRDHVVPWLVMAGIVLVVVVGDQAAHIHELLWAEDAPDSIGLGFGGWWYLYVARPIFLMFLLAWIWRIVLVFLLMRRIAAMNLDLVPTHPDHAGGLGFLQQVPAGFAGFAFAASAVLAAHWAHDVVYHGVVVQSLYPEAGAFLGLVVLLCVSPLLAFVGPLLRAKRRGLREYGALVARHGRLIDRRWIQADDSVHDPLLDASELGAAVDVYGLFQLVKKMQPIPLGRQAIASVVLPALVPMLALAALQVPIKSIVVKLLTALA